MLLAGTAGDFLYPNTLLAMQPHPEYCNYGLLVALIPRTAKTSNMSVHDDVAYMERYNFTLLHFISCTDWPNSHYYFQLII